MVLNSSVVMIKNVLSRHKIPIIYTLSSVLKASATLVSGFIIAKFISPADFGLWTTLSLLTSYALIFQGGIINGLSLELPLMLGKGDTNKGNLLVGVAQTITIYLSLIVLILAAVVFLLYPFDNNKERYGFLGVSLIIVFTYCQNYLLATFRSNHQFLKLSYIQIIEALMSFASVALVFYYSYYGMILKAVIVIVLFVSILAINRPIKAKMQWDKNIALHLLKIGVPIFLMAYIEMLALTVDKIFLLKYTNVSKVGIYSFAFYAFSFITLFSTSLASYIYPKLTYKYGETKDKKILWVYVKKITILLLTVQFPCALIGYFVIPYMVTLYFPNYIESIVPMQILLFAGVLKGSVVGANVLWSLKKWKYMILYQVSYAIFFVLLTYLFISFLDNKIVGVCLGVLFSNIINLFNGVYLSYRATNEKVEIL